jgi:hypothetical protein
MSLKIYSVINASTPNKEVVGLKTSIDVNLKDYAIVDKTFDKNGNTSNKFRHIFIFPDVAVKKGEFMRVYSGKGKYKTTTNEKGNNIHHFFWNSDECIWNNEGDLATLISFSLEGNCKVSPLEDS